LKIKQKGILMTMLLISSISSVEAGGVCNIQPGSVNCGHGTVEHVYGNGMVNIDGTTVTGATMVNGSLSAKDANFLSLDVNGSAHLMNSIVNEQSSIKGELTASSTKFEHGLTIYSNSTKLIKSTIKGDLHVPHINPKKQVIYLDNASEVTGDIVFDDGHGMVFIRGKSRVGGHIIGGTSSSQ
jgi:hypothetical protein